MTLSNFKLVNGEEFLMISRYKLNQVIKTLAFRKYIERRKWKALLLQNHEIRLELGAGGKRGSNGWTTVDFGGADISHDLRRGIPLPDSSVHHIYSSHFLEHLDFKEILSILQECKRVLVNGGRLSTAVPNAKFYLDAYSEGREFKDKELMHQPSICHTDSLIDQINYIAYMGKEHKYMFDEENLVKIFKIAGFRKSSIRAFDRSLDEPEREYESIYSIAFK